MHKQPGQPASLGAALAGHHNSLGFLRLLFASAVLVAHASPLGGFGFEPLREFSRGQFELGGLAVIGFLQSVALSSQKAQIIQTLCNSCGGGYYEYFQPFGSCY